MSMKHFLSLLLAALAGYSVSPSYSQDAIFCSGFENCVNGGGDLEARVAALEALLADVARGTDPNTGQDTLKFAGMNLQVVDGSDNTDGPPNGTGNVIIGYNELRAEGNFRTGSHMLVIGRLNNYTSYGGMVVGANNNAYGAQSSITGGSSNTASGIFAAISGGYFNTASGQFYPSVSGGYLNEASGDYSSISGGRENDAPGNYSSVTAGLGNQAIGPDSSISGGWSGEAVGQGSTISGGVFNAANGHLSAILGGQNKTTSTDYCVVGDSGVDC